MSVLHRSVVALLLVLPATAARGEGAVDETVARDVADAPRPGDESGRLDRPPGDSLARDVAQGVLAVSRIAFEIALAPVRASAIAHDRYQLYDRWKQVFFDESLTYGLYPTAVLDSTYGLSVGTRFVHRNVFGKHERLALRARGGGEYHAALEAAVRSGQRLGRVHVDVHGELEQRPHDEFFGIGNAVDPVEARHRQEIQRISAVSDLHVVSDLHLDVAGSFTKIAYSRADGEYEAIDELYSPMTLTGWDGGVKNLYGEAQLRWDSRGMSGGSESAAHDHGWLVAAYGGRVRQLAAGADYWRYGGDIQKLTRLGAGPRVLALRFLGESVTGGLEDVALTQLPRLGGRALLRGYPRDRFRDRAFLMTTAEYEWDLSRNMMATLFVDVGRVYPAWTELHYENMRVGYGMSLQLHAERDFVASLQVATSIDGGVFVDLAFDPVFAIEPRVVRQ